MITLELGAAPAKPLSMNERGYSNYHKRHRLTAPWKARAKEVAELAEVTGLPLPLEGGPWLVTVVVPVKGDYRRDPHNYMPVVKAVIDGLVAAGVWPDDTPQYVCATEPALVTDGLARVNLTLRDQ
jgi:hypothetical protein